MGKSKAYAVGDLLGKVVPVDGLKLVIKLESEKECPKIFEANGICIEECIYLSLYLIVMCILCYSLNEKQAVVMVSQLYIFFFSYCIGSTETNKEMSVLADLNICCWKK